MIRSLKEKINVFFNKGQERTVLTKKNIAASFGVKGITIVITFIMVPMTIRYVGEERNGIWITLSSMIAWMTLFDIGFGNGLKNKYAEAKARGEVLLAKKYVSSTYAIICLLWIVIFGIFILINPYLNWGKILKTASPEYISEINDLVWICVSSFGLVFILKLLSSIVTADQRPAIASFVDMLGQLLSLIGVFILMKTTSATLPKLGVVVGFSPVVIYLIASIVLFNGRYKKVRPSFKYIDLKLAKNMLNLGIKFFVATCAAFIISGTLSFLIMYMTNPIEVTRYNTAFKLFSMAFNVMGIIIIPYWSAFTDAYTLKDYDWMKRSVKKLRQLYIGFLVFQTILLLLSPIVYYLWIDVWQKQSLGITWSMTIAVFLYTCVLSWINLNIYPLNGIGKIQLQLYSSILEMVLLFPLAFWMGNRWGAVGIILTPVIIYIPRMIWAPLQLNKLIQGTASGLLNK